MVRLRLQVWLGEELSSNILELLIGECSWVWWSLHTLFGQATIQPAKLATSLIANKAYNVVRIPAPPTPCRSSCQLSHLNDSATLLQSFLQVKPDSKCTLHTYLGHNRPFNVGMGWSYLNPPGTSSVPPSIGEVATARTIAFAK